ncbi:hypothetical protein D3C87_725580 [compost metagenome]
MKTIQARSFFKKIAATSSNPRSGQKRPDLQWEYQALEAEDVASLEPSQVATALNSVVEAFGRKLIAASGDDWNFSPSNVTFESAYADLIAERTSSRLVTKESLKALGEFYKSQAVKVLGVALPAAQAGCNVISDRFKAIAGKNDVLEVMAQRLESLVEKCEEEEILPFVELIEVLMKELQELQEIKVSADML